MENRSRRFSRFFLIGKAGIKIKLRYGRNMELTDQEFKKL